MSGLSGLNLGGIATMGADIGQAAANAPDFWAKTQIAQGQAQGLNLENQQKQMELQGNQAQNAALAKNMQGLNLTGDPLADMDLKAEAKLKTAQELAAQGQGDKATAMLGEVAKDKQAKQGMIYSRLAQASLLNDADAIQKIVTDHLGHKDVAKVALDEGGENWKYLDKNGDTLAVVPKKPMDRLDWTPAEHATELTRMGVANVAAQSRVDVAQKNFEARTKVAELMSAKAQSDIGRIRADEAKGVENGGISHADAEARIKKLLEPHATVGGAAGGMFMPPAGSSPGSVFEPDPMRPWRQHPSFQALVRDPKMAEMANAVDMYLNGDAQIQAGRASAHDKAVMAWAHQIDPNANQGDYGRKQRVLLDHGGEIEAGNTTMKHLNDFVNKYNQLDSQTQSRLANTKINDWETAFKNNENSKIISELKAINLSLSNEYGDALGASKNVVGDVKREEVFDPAQPPKNIEGRVQAVATLLLRRLNSKENMITLGNPNRIPISLVNPGVADIFDRFGAHYYPGGRPNAPTPKQTLPNPEGPTAAPKESPAPTGKEAKAVANRWLSEQK